MFGLFVTIQLPQMNVTALPTVTGRTKKALERTYLIAVPACTEATTPGGQCADPGWVGMARRRSENPFAAVTNAQRETSVDVDGVRAVVVARQ